MATQRTQQVSYISKVEKCKKKINEKPEKFLNKIGSFLVSETKRKQRKKTGRMRKGTQYWARKREKDLQIGTKCFYEPAFERGNKKIRKEETFEPTVKENINTIQILTRASYSELDGEG
ncbi:hypothetical protein [Clostridium sp. 1001270J_160509_D11]|uniref:hypothetical protein n=1 Tax=Clostridium sp. 1001270J_160509_D11 TaxID=2787103 RepID=UPI0018AB4CF1|nr:hypothetical protein [Clostridium sp. 1001270J_160509_D11]